MAAIAAVLAAFLVGIGTTVPAAAEPTAASSSEPTPTEPASPSPESPEEPATPARDSARLTAGATTVPDGPVASLAAGTPQTWINGNNTWYAYVGLGENLDVSFVKDSGAAPHNDATVQVPAGQQPAGVCLDTDPLCTVNPVAGPGPLPDTGAGMVTLTVLVAFGLAAAGIGVTMATRRRLDASGRPPGRRNRS